MIVVNIDQAREDNLAIRLRARRKEVGWTQEELARRVGTSQAVIQKIENGKSLRPRKIDRIAEMLGTTPAWLMFGDYAADDLDDEAIELAKAWQMLREPHRSAHKRAILERAASLRSLAV